MQPPSRQFWQTGVVWKLWHFAHSCVKSLYVSGTNPSPKTKVVAAVANMP